MIRGSSSSASVITFTDDFTTLSMGYVGTTEHSGAMDDDAVNTRDMHTRLAPVMSRVPSNTMLLTRQICDLTYVTL